MSQLDFDGNEDRKGMKILGFKACYITPILDGSKTSTLRRPSARLPAPGEQFKLRCHYDRPPFAIAECVSTRDVCLETMTDRIARADGFPNVDALRAAVVELYPGVERFRLIRFQLLDAPTL